MASIDIGSRQVPTVFGDGFVREQHSEAADRKIAANDDPAPGIAGVWLVFYVVIALAAVAHKGLHLF